MAQKFLTIVLPLVLPLALYWLYVVMARRRARAAGSGDPLLWHEGPWVWFALAGVILMAASLVTLRLMTGADPSDKIEPPHVVDGKVVPSRVIK